MFTPEDRDRVRDQVIGWAKTDARVVAGAIVGSLARRPGDRWSDLDLTFAVDDRADIDQVLAEWSERLRDHLDAVRLFDLRSGGATYRVFLLPGCLQFDLSFSPAAQFGAMGPNFSLLFGTANQKPFPAPPLAEELLGYGVHHAVRAHVCIERERSLQAEYWISGVRDHALSLACLRLGLPTHYGRGFDDLPEPLRAAFVDALVRSLDRVELLRALGHATAALWRQAPDGIEGAKLVEARLKELFAF